MNVALSEQRRVAATCVARSDHKWRVAELLLRVAATGLCGVSIQNISQA
jgi:hypothetical protein